MNDNDILRLAALKVVSDYTKKCYDLARAEAAAQMERGDRRIARVDSEKLGAVSKTDPKPVALIGDEAAFTEWLLANYPDSVAYDLDIIGSDQEVKAVLFEHAPQLVRSKKVPSPDLVRRIKNDSAQLGVPIGPSGEAEIPGLTVSQPDGDVRCKPDEGALATVIHLFRAGKLDLESLVLPELTGGES